MNLCSKHKTCRMTMLGGISRLLEYEYLSNDIGLHDLIHHGSIMLEAIMDTGEVPFIGRVDVAFYISPLSWHNT